MATLTTKLVKRGRGRWEVMIPLAPVPASRPRVSRWGTYYLKTYAAWKDDAQKLLSKFAVPGLFSGAVSVQTIVACKRPKKPANPWPVGDIDNYEKAAYDAVTKAKCVWEDDTQITSNRSVKRYARDGEEPHTLMIITEEECE